MEALFGKLTEDKLELGKLNDFKELQSKFEKSHEKEEI